MLLAGGGGERPRRPGCTQRVHHGPLRRRYLIYSCVLPAILTESLLCSTLQSVQLLMCPRRICTGQAFISPSSSRAHSKQSFARRCCSIHPWGMPLAQQAESGVGCAGDHHLHGWQLLQGVLPRGRALHGHLGRPHSPQGAPARCPPDVDKTSVSEELPRGRTARDE